MGDRLDTLSTYRHLRLGMALLLGLLIVAVVVRAADTPTFCFEESISAYYFTSVRAVLVAALCALGACLIVYQGNTDAEDIALNASGALAFVVAFVPTAAPGPGEPVCSASNVPGPTQLQDAVDNNMVALFLVASLALAVAITLTARSTRLSRAPLRALVAFAGVLGLGVTAFALWPAGFRANAHQIAAVGTFIGIVTVVALNARGAARARRGEASAARYRNVYGLIGATMAASAVVIGVADRLVSGWRHGVLFIEAALLGQFMVFWLVQTVELWDRTRRDAPAVPRAAPAS